MAAIAEEPTAQEAIADTADWPYRFEVIMLADMIVDHTYQRPLTSFAKKIAENFDPALVGTLVLSERAPKRQGQKAKFAVVDGQTRMGGAELRGVTELPALVYEGLTVAQEASLFARLQKERKGIASFHRFRAQIIAKEPEALAISKIVNDAGYLVAIDGNKPMEITAVAGLEKVYRIGPDMLERVLMILMEAWGENYVPTGDTLRGLAYFLKHTKDVDDERLAEKLKGATPEELKRRASALREGSGHGGGSDKYMAGAIEGVYNRRGGR